MFCTVDLLVTGIACLSFAAFGTWLVMNRSRLDAEGRKDPNTYISTGYTAFIVFGLAAVSGFVFLYRLLA